MFNSNLSGFKWWGNTSTSTTLDQPSHSGIILRGSSMTLYSYASLWAMTFSLMFPAFPSGKEESMCLWRCMSIAYPSCLITSLMRATWTWGAWRYSSNKWHTTNSSSLRKWLLDKITTSKGKWIIEASNNDRKIKISHQKQNKNNWKIKLI